MAAADGPVSASARGKLHCDSHAPGGDSRDITCPLSASGTAQRYRFRASFSGSHDDTTASMAITLDGTPLACEPGGKTSLMGEDGDVSLECRFATTQKAGTKPVLRVQLAWRHAQYTAFEFASD
jgi:hypothetical protein